jgi:hypothetical protein
MEAGTRRNSYGPVPMAMKRAAGVGHARMNGFANCDRALHLLANCISRDCRLMQTRWIGRKIEIEAVEASQDLPSHAVREVQYRTAKLPQSSE